MGRKYDTTASTGGRKYGSTSLGNLSVSNETSAPTTLDRLFGLLSAGETAPAAYAYLSGEDPLKAYLTSAGKGLTLQGYGGKKTYSDVLSKLGMPDSLVRSIAGTALDIGLDPTTYLGGLIAKPLEGGLKVAGETSTKLPIVGSKIKTAKEALQDLLVPGAKLTRSGEEGAKYYEDYLKFAKGTRGKQTQLIQDLAKSIKTMEDAGISRSTILEAEKGINKLPINQKEAVQPIIDLLSEWGGKESERGLLQSQIENYIPHILSPEGRDFVTQGCI